MMSLSSDRHVSMSQNYRLFTSIWKYVGRNLANSPCNDYWAFTLLATYLLVVTYCIISRLTVVSREAKKKQHARASSGLRDHYSELFTRMAALKFENAVTQPP